MIADIKLKVEILPFLCMCNNNVVKITRKCVSNVSQSIKYPTILVHVQ